MSATKIEFSQYHRPALESGEYELSISQTLTVDNTERLNDKANITKIFYVAGERFHILPGNISSMYPPANSLGEYSSVLPHIMLSRNTLPWEREPFTGSTQTPWLALLVVYEDEADDATVSSVTLGDLEAGSNSSPFFPSVALELGQSSGDPVNVLDIKKSLLSKIAPDQSTLEYMSHVRKGIDANGDVVGNDIAALVASRLPNSSGSSTVYLVSMENRYDSSAGTFDFDDSATDGDLIRLVMLHKWTFTCMERFRVTAERIADASSLSSTVTAKLSQLVGEEFFTKETFKTRLDEVFTSSTESTELASNLDQIYEDFAFGDFAQILKQLNRTPAKLRLPDVSDTTINTYLQSGFYPLPHKLRKGAQTVSWYHGPLLPDSDDSSGTFPADGPDALLRYYKSISMFDVSYAAAWELGKLLALQNTSFSTSLYQWKRRYAKAISMKAQVTNNATSHLRSGKRAITAESIPGSVYEWLQDLSYLKGVPFNYMVPDEELLPEESIRFFQLDKLWIKSLLDGAFSIGRVTSNDAVLDNTIQSEISNLTSQYISGFILRSEVVSGWPDMIMEGYSNVPTSLLDDSNLTTPLTIIREERLSKNVLLCLFESSSAAYLQTLDLHLKPEALHFGFDLKTDGSYEKTLRDTTGIEVIEAVVDVPLDTTSRMLDISGLKANISASGSINSIGWDSSTPTSSHFALQLLEGVERVRFSGSL